MLRSLPTTLEQPGIDRVAILDWDVHHGNGTQAIVEIIILIVRCISSLAILARGSIEQGAYDNVLNAPAFGQHGGGVPAAV